MFFQTEVFMSQSKQQTVTEMFNDISDTYDKVNSILSLGIHKIWRKSLIKQLPKNKEHHLLDLATGTGDVLIEALKKKRTRFATGADLAQKMIEIGEQKLMRTRFAAQGCFCIADARELPFKAHTFDSVSISFGIRNVQDPLEGLKEMHRVLKDNGQALILEFSLPKNKLLRKAHLFYLRKVLPKLGGFFSKSPDSYLYLNQTIESFPHGEAFIDLMRQAGFKNAICHPLTFGIASLYIGKK